MFQQAGIEIILIILWVLFSIYGSVQQKKKRELAKQQPAKPVKPANTTSESESTEEDPFKKMMEELFGEQKLEQEVRTEKKEDVREGKGEVARPFYQSETNVPSSKEYKKPVYESIPVDMKTPSTLGDDYNLSDTGDLAYTPLTSMLLPSQEGQPSTLGREARKQREIAAARAVPQERRKLLINGRPMSMKDAITAQIILEKRI